MPLWAPVLQFIWPLCSTLTALAVAQHRTEHLGLIAAAAGVGLGVGLIVCRRLCREIAR